MYTDFEVQKISEIAGYVGCIILSETRMVESKGPDHMEDAPHFITTYKLRPIYAETLFHNKDTNVSVNSGFSQ